MPTGLSPSLDARETSQQRPPENTYGDLLRSRDPREHRATEELFTRLGRGPTHIKTVRLRACRSIAWFVRNSETGLVRVRSSNCHDRWCPLCASSKGYRIGRNVEEWVRSVDRPKLLTLTLRHSDAPLKDQLDHLITHFQNFRRRPLIRRAWRGGIWFIQVTFNGELQQWHPHLHVLLDADFVAQSGLSRLWKEVTLSSSIVDIRSVRDPAYAAKYVARYVGRPVRLSDVPVDRLVAIDEAFRSRRLVGTWGTALFARVLRKPTPEPGKWRSIGTYASVFWASQFDSDAQLILQSWLSHLPLPADISCSRFDPDFVEPLASDLPDPPVQTLFDWS